MPATLQAAQITEAYRSGALGVRGALLMRLNTAWQLLVDPESLNDSWPAFAQMAAGLTGGAQQQLAAGSLRYLQQYVSASIGDTVDQVDLDISTYVGQARVGRPLVGILQGFPPVLLGQIKAGRPLDDTMTAGQAVVNRLCGSSALDAARGALDDAMTAEPRVRGRYRRVASGSCCVFCAALAARGAVYRTEESGGFEAHPHCSCTAEPDVDGADEAFTREHPKPENAPPTQQQLDAFWARFNQR